jgi:hypothetical protein
MPTRILYFFLSPSSLDWESALSVAVFVYFLYYFSTFISYFLSYSSASSSIVGGRSKA